MQKKKLEGVQDFKVIAGEDLTTQHRVVVCRISLQTKALKTKRHEPRIRWWLLHEKTYRERFRQSVEQSVSRDNGLENWKSISDLVRGTAREVLGITSGSNRQNKETWWWNEEVQHRIKDKREAKKQWDRTEDDECRAEYIEKRREAKRAVAKAKDQACNDLYEKLESKEGEKEVYRIAKQRDRTGQDMQQTRLVKDVDGNILSEDRLVRNR